MQVRVRYAPSPTGSPHVGNIRTAILNWLYARRTGGVFIARLEDTDRDPERYRPETIAEIEESLEALGITPDEWWKSGGPAGPYVQSERLSLYREAAEKLVASGSAYPCFCSAERLAEMRAEQQSAGGVSGYDRRCRSLAPGERERLLAAGEPHTIRLAVPLEGNTAYRDIVYGEVTFENRLIDDQVLLKSNGWPTYHLAVVVDDHAMGITHVLRGEDWMPSTPKQILLYRMLRWQPPQWAHLPLIVGSDRKKLSKRHGSTQFVEFVRAGYLPEALFNFLALLGWSAGEANREIFSREEIVERFCLDGITNHPAIFDYEKLRWMNGEYIRAADSASLLQMTMPRLVAEGLVKNPPTQEERAIAAKVIPLIAERMKLLSDAPQLMDYFFRDPREPDEKGRRKWLTGADAAERLTEARKSFYAVEGELTEENAEAVVNALAERLTGGERGPIIHTLRLAVTGRTAGPGLFETLAALGKARVLERLERAEGWVLRE